jgi:hypothetical protein
MIKFRNCLLVTLVLAATMVAVIGTGTAQAARIGQAGRPSASHGSVHRSTGPFSGCGEPDNGNNGLPKVTVPSIAAPAGTGWILTQWIHWTWTVSNSKNLRAR